MESVHNIVEYHGFCENRFSITVPYGYLEPFIRIIGSADVIDKTTGYLVTSKMPLFTSKTEQKTIEFLKSFCKINLLEIKGIDV